MDDDSFAADDTTTTLPRNPLLNLTHDASSSITPLEQEVLDEYTRLLNNMNQVSPSSAPSSRPIHTFINKHLV